MSMPHEWVGAANVLLAPQHAAQATRTGKVMLSGTLQIEVLDVHCRRCRRDYETGKNEECVLGSQHIGGPRKQPDPMILEVNGWPNPHDPLI